MVAPPILEIYVVWHPKDTAGAKASTWLREHFHSAAYAGLAGGAVEVYERSAGWSSPAGPPRPLPFMAGGAVADLPQAQFTVVVPVIGRSLANAVRDDDEWRQYVSEIAAFDVRGGRGDSSAVAVHPVRIPKQDLSRSVLTSVLGRGQDLGITALVKKSTLARELAQGITQELRGGHPVTEDERVTVFVSHTKWHTDEPKDDAIVVVDDVRAAIQHTRLGSFFDAHDVQAGADWEAELVARAGRCAMLMVRTDLYSTREWTQREVEIAKRHDLPIVAMYAVRNQEDRGSFLMDHVPVIACPPGSTGHAIRKALNRLVDEALKAALWERQQIYLRADGFDWLPVHPPELVTLLAWLPAHLEAGPDRRIIIMHPDPPLGEPERASIVRMCRAVGATSEVDVLTPRTFAARGGRVHS